MRLPNDVLILAAALVVVPIHAAHAYIGPGAGITIIGVVIAFVSAVVLAVVGFVWYPIRRLRAKRKDRRKSDKGPTPP